MVPGSPASCAFVVLLILLGGVVPAAAGGGTVEQDFASSEASGYRIYHVHNDADLTVAAHLEFLLNTYEPTPMLFFFVHGTGAVTILSKAFDGFDDAENLDGDAVVYAGGPTTNVEAPAVFTTPSVPESVDLTTNLNDTDGWLVVAWANHEGTTSMNSTWTAGTTIALASAGTSVGTFELKDFRGGARAAFVPAAAANLADSLAFPASNFLAYTSYDHGQTFGRGGLDYAWPNGSARIDLDGTYDPTVDCSCPSQGRLVLGGDGPLTITANFAGVTRDTNAWITVLSLPDGTIPVPVFYQNEATITP